LKDVSFTVSPGQSVALVGHTGSGKTTITNLLMRFYDVQKGRILLDGVDVRDWELQSLRENFAVVLQDIFLFTGTVESNIRLGRADISDERIRWQPPKSAPTISFAACRMTTNPKCASAAPDCQLAKTVDFVCAGAGLRSGVADPG